MIVKELELTNIRSYDHAVISFPLGKTLFEGDIGSGKSTILMAMEFALFGLGSGTGSSLLKAGEKDGKVGIKLDVDGREVGIERHLKKKGGSVHQTEGRVTTPEEEVDLSPSELKQRVLEILEFNEAPDPKAQSMIYRYAVYTPQEEMKEILSMRADLRLQTLRRAFRVEDYKVAAENAGELSRELGSETRAHAASAQGLDDLRAQAERLDGERGERELTIARLTKLETETDTGLKALKDKEKALREASLTLERTRTELNMQERLESDARREASTALKAIERSQTRIANLAATPGRLDEAIPDPAAAAEELAAKEAEVEGEVRQLAASAAVINSKLEGYQKIAGDGVCPLCDSPIQEHDFSKHVAAKDAERKRVESDLAEAEQRLAVLKGQRMEAERLGHERKLLEANRAMTAQLEEEVRQRRGDMEAANLRAKQAAESAAKLEKQLEEMKTLGEELRANEKALETAEYRLRGIREELSTERTEVRRSAERRTELKAEIAMKEKASSRRDDLAQVQIWLGDYFTPSVGLIERSVLSTINQEFQSLLQKWFGMLVSDPEMEVSLDDEFTPIVSQRGYEQDLRFLSGGERTSVALAYRLALNSLVQKVSVGMRSNLLVLDEPTDGFSQEQLGNVREVLDETGCSQVIIVSHDKELESFADQVFRVEKEQGRSAVRLAGR